MSRPDPTPDPATARIEVLGPLAARVTTADGSVDLTPRSVRERTALAVLAVAAPQAVSVETLAAELYAEDEIADPRNAVQAVISRLRRALRPADVELIVTDPAGYRLGDAALDLDDLAARHASGDAAAALATWRGEALADVDGGDLLSAERARLDELRSALTERLLTDRVDTDPATTIADLEAAVAAAPLREHRWALLMLALYRSGRQADALRAFQRARSHLRAELGIDPGTDLIELEGRILAQDPTLLVATRSASRPSAPLPTGTVTVVLCDVEGSVRRWEHAPGDTAELIQEMHELWEEAVATSGGVMVKSTGDGILAAFDRAGDALVATARGQRAQRSTGLTVRAAVHTGEVITTDDDLRGPTVNRVARLLELAHGGQTLASGITADLARGAIGAGDHEHRLSLRPLGAHHLRDVDGQLEIFQLDGDGLPSAFPALQSTGTSRLPRLRTDLYGRERELDDLVDAVADHPLVTVVGTGGIGKTSLALAVGWRLADLRPVSFVDLASLRDPAHVAQRVAETLLGADPNHPRTPEQRLTDRLAVNPDLLVIDNAEHVLDAVAALSDELLASDLKGSLLVTSRQTLGITGERVVRISPLALPDVDDDLAATARNASVQLFLARMRTARPDASLPDGLLPVVAHICRRLDGIPLAIELAAGRTALLPVEEVAARLDDQLRLLRQVPPAREQRHASLEAVTRWSLDQLAPATGELFARLSVMPGSFDLAAAEALAERCGLDERDTLDGIGELVAASLLVADVDAGRFRMLEPIRQIATVELETAGADRSTRAAHADWIADRLIEAHAARDEARRPRYCSFDHDGDHLLAAVRFIVEEVEGGRGGVDLERAVAMAMGASFWFLEHDPGLGTPLLRRLADAVDRETHPLVWARATTAWVVTTATMPVDGAAEDALAAVAIHDEHDVPDRGIARLCAVFSQFGADGATARRLLVEAETLVPSDEIWTWAVLDLIALMLEAAGSLLDPPQGSIDEALRRGERSAATLRHLGDRWTLGAALGELGRLHRLRGDIDAAAAYYHESIDLFGDLHYHGMHYILSELGHIAALHGEIAESQRLHARAMRMAIDDGNPGCRAQTLIGSARSELVLGQPDEAERLVRQARDLHPDWDLLGYGFDTDLDDLRALLPD